MIKKITENNFKQTMEVLLFSLLSYIFFVSLIYGAELNNGLLFLFSILFFFLPINFNFIIHGYKAIVITTLIALSLTFVNYELALITIALFILPAFIAFIINKNKPFNIGYVLTYLSLYFSLIYLIIVYYYYHTSKNMNIYNQIYDSLHYFTIILQTEESSSIDANELSAKLELLSVFLPSIIIFIAMAIFIFNYRLTLIISNRNYNKKYLLNNYLPPNLFKFILVIIAIISIILHKFLEKEIILYYTLYNVFLILWLCYFYLGLEFIWQKLEATKNMGFKIIFGVSLVLLFFELLLIICIIGFLIDMKIIKNNYFIKHKF